MYLIILLISLAVTVGCILLVRSLDVMSSKELKRQARKGNKHAEVVYVLKSYGFSVWLSIWLLFGLSFAIFVLSLDKLLPLVIALPIDMIVIVVLHVILPKTKAIPMDIKLASVTAPYIIKWIQLINPVISRVGPFIGKHFELDPLRLVHSKDDLLELIKNTEKVDTVSKDELMIASSALTFGDKKISQVMTPRIVIKAVNAEEKLTLVVLNELSKSGFSRFPVWDETGNRILGILYIKDVIDLKSEKYVKEVMRRDMHYVNEDSGLDQALNAFLRTKQHMFLVVNEFEDIVGVITIEDVLEQIIGRKIVDEFDQYENMREVARLEAVRRKEKYHHKQAIAPESKQNLSTENK